MGTGEQQQKGDFLEIGKSPPSTNPLSLYEINHGAHQLQIFRNIQKGLNWPATALISSVGLEEMKTEEEVKQRLDFVKTFIFMWSYKVIVCYVLLV